MNGWKQRKKEQREVKEGRSNRQREGRKKMLKRKNGRKRGIEDTKSQAGNIAG